MSARVKRDPRSARSDPGPALASESTECTLLRVLLTRTQPATPIRMSSVATVIPQPHADMLAGTKSIRPSAGSAARTTPNPIVWQHAQQPQVSCLGACGWSVSTSSPTASPTASSASPPIVSCPPPACTGRRTLARPRPTKPLCEVALDQGLRGTSPLDFDAWVPHAPLMQTGQRWCSGWGTRLESLLFWGCSSRNVLLGGNPSGVAEQACGRRLV